MFRLSKQVFKNYITTLEQLHKNNFPIDIEIFPKKSTQKPPHKPDYEDELKPNPDYNKDYYKD